VRRAEIHAGSYQSVDLTPESESLIPRVRYTSAAVPAAGTPPAEQAGPRPDWAARFVRLRSLSKAVPDPSAQYTRWTEQLPGSFTFFMMVRRQAVVFVQLARSAQVPLNVALPAGNGACLLTVEERAGVLYASALPLEGPRAPALCRDVWLMVVGLEQARFPGSCGSQRLMITTEARACCQIIAEPARAGPALRCFGPATG
jgi:hypothetical protein